MRWFSKLWSVLVSKRETGVSTKIISSVTEATFSFLFLSSWSFCAQTTALCWTFGQDILWREHLHLLWYVDVSGVLPNKRWWIPKNVSRRSQFLLAVNGTLNADFKNDYGVKGFTVRLVSSGFVSSVLSLVLNKLAAMLEIKFLFPCYTFGNE